MFIEPMAGLNLMTNADDFVSRHPEYGERFDAIQERRELYEAIQDTTGRSPAFKSVASLCLPVERVLWVTNPDFLRDKTKFYAWLDANPQYCTYDRRKAQAPTTRPHTYVDGKAV